MSTNEAVDQIIDGKYKVDKQLGKGGMGTVFLATHIGTGRPVAVKVIAAQFMQKAEFVERFRREAQAAGRLRHPNVVDVTDFGFSVSEDGTKSAYLVMEYLDGCTLGEVLDEETKLPLQFTIEILEQVCSAVDEAHRQGIIHRDLKPDNIWLEPNQRGGYTVKVLDFGIAKLEEAQVAAIAGVSEDLLVRDVSKTRLSVEKGTIAEDPNPGTRVEGSPSAVTGEGETLALGAESNTLSGNDPKEAGTIVQEQPEPASAERDPSEAGTKAISTDSTGSFEKVDKLGTRLNSDVIETDEGDEKGTADLTRAGAVLGTPLYMSPEQCRGEKLTPASDIYSLSVIVYQMLSGKLPFSGDYVEVMNGHKNEEPPPLQVRKAPKKLKGIVMSSLSKDINKRPESAEALASKLRSNSEGLGVLLRRSLVMYGEHLPKFLLLTLVCFLPVIFLTFARIGLSFYLISGGSENEVLRTLNAAGFGIIMFFFRGIAVALLIGMTTWMVGRLLAYPLRPISLRTAFREVSKRWKALAITVTVSSLLILVSFAMCVLPGIWLAARYMMIAPAVMMEGLNGRKAFKRSVELYKRSVWTMLSVSALHMLIPVIIALVVGFSIGSMIKTYELSNEIKKMKREGVVAQKVEEDSGVNISINRKGTIREKKVTKKADGTVEKKNMADSFTTTLQEGIFELVWTPIALIINSFIAVLTALIYFKLRQAGGESLQHLLGKLEDEEGPQSKWEMRVRERLIQSGKITGATSQG